MEDINVWIHIVVSVVVGIATCIPLIIKLVNTVKEAAQAKNWTPLMQLILKLMSEAEENYSSGAERKAYVVDSIEAIKDTLNYEVDMAIVSEMIDSIVLATKKINVKKK
jgi:hypothetical protein